MEMGMKGHANQKLVLPMLRLAERMSNVPCEWIIKRPDSASVKLVSAECLKQLIYYALISWF